MKPKSAIAKGKILENYLVDLIKQVYPEAHRQPGSGSGKHRGDVVFGNWTVQCKNTKNFNFKEAVAEVKKDAMGYRKELIVWHKQNTPLDDSVAIVNINDFMDLLKSEKNNQSSDEILDKYSIKSNLEKGIFFLKKVVKNL
ncbi:MAG: hypothetical protein AABY22_21255 [Nanoarchaeota archaeon]